MKDYTQFLKMGHWVQVQTMVFQTKDIPCTNSGVSNTPFLKTALIPVDVIGNPLGYSAKIQAS